MAFEIEWTKRAEIEFDDIIEYLTKEWTNSVKNNFIVNFYNKLDLISLFPELGISISRKEKIRGMLITEHIRMYYRIRNKKIILITFFDTRQNPKKLKL
jgi:plasmid stabilization system protein ParE